MEIDDASAGDVLTITRLQNAFVATRTWEYREAPHDVADRLDWLRWQQAASLPVLVARDNGAVVGWASYGPFRDNVRWPGYRHSVEHTVHVAESHWGHGIGWALMLELQGRARQQGVHVMIAGIDSTNAPSIAFHERIGFVECARIREVGRKLDRWLDLILMQQIVTG